MSVDMERATTRLEALRTLLDDASKDVMLPVGTRERLALMTGRMTIEIEMLGIRGTLHSEPPAAAAPAPTPTPPTPPPAPRVLKTQCLDGWSNHSWQGSNACHRCGAKR